MDQSNTGVSLSRRLLSLVLAVIAFLPILKIHAQGPTSFPMFGCYAEGTICEEWGEFGTGLTTSRISYCRDEPTKVSLQCSTRENKGCITSQCMPKSRSKRDEECRVVNMMDRYGEKNHTLNAYQEDCSLTEEKIVCCQPDSDETVLLAGYGAEAHEFPHQALLVLSFKNENRSPGYWNSICGGTIYNEKYILTAAHCVVNSFTHNKAGEEELQNSEDLETNQIEVVVGTNIGLTARASNRYRIKRIVVHPRYGGKLIENKDDAIKNIQVINDKQNDVALLEVEGTIKFDKYTKALKIAPPDFRPGDYADKVVIVGWGTTDNLHTTEYLQKANLMIRHEYDEWPCNNDTEFVPDQHLCLGGMIDNVQYGKTAGGGDSGGPAICRDKDGFGVLCGITSFGGSDEHCSEMSNKDTCTPSVYVDVSYFREWIIENAGTQDTENTEFYEAPLYGINATDEMAQVKIYSGDGKTCGGTLVSDDTVVTASNCIYDKKGEPKTLVVKYGCCEHYVDFVQLITPHGEAGSSVVNRGFYESWRNHSGFRPYKVEEPYYDANIGVIKLSDKISGARPAALSTSKLVANEDTIYEAAWMRNSTLGLRIFPSSVISNENCQGRYDRISKKYQSFPIGEMDVCMVEKYSGGNECDRELGGGVFCEGPNGITLCGVQVFRMCDFSTPKIIADMYYYAKRVNQFVRKKFTRKP